jgi:hypothetical protein
LIPPKQGGKMFKKLFIALTMVVSGSVFASNSDLVSDVTSAVNQKVMGQTMLLGFTFNPGDTNHYDINMGFISGKMDMTVREKTPEGYVWIDQNIDLGFLGKQKVETLLDPSTGKIIKMIVNGKEEAPPTADDSEVVETKEDTVTVPAGTFKAIYFKIRTKSNNSESQQWINPKEVPISGMIKGISPSQFGDVNIELTSFERK